jgi:hypothetical protein
MRRLLFAMLVSSGLHAEDISLPLDDGDLLIHADFVWKSVPELTMQIVNQTSSPWQTLKLEFDVGSLCNGQPHQLTIPFVSSLGWLKDFKMSKKASVGMFLLAGKEDHCQTEIITAKLVYAENSKTRIDGVTGERVDLEKQLQEIKIKRDAEAAQRAEQERKDKEADEAREKRLEAERKRKQAEEDARYAKLKAQEEAKAAAERRRLQAICRIVYRNTIDRKVTDLTVREEGQVRACRALGLYPPD